MHEAAATARCWPHLNVTQLSGDANSIFARLGGQVGIYTYTMYWLVATALVVGWWVGTSSGAICENNSIKSVRTFLRSSPTHAINRSNVPTKLPYGRFISSSSLSLFFFIAFIRSDFRNRRHASTCLATRVACEQDISWHDVQSTDHQSNQSGSPFANTCGSTFRGGEY